MKDLDAQLIIERLQAYRETEHYHSKTQMHYTLVMVTGDHSQDHLVLRSFGEVPDEKVQSMVNYVMGIARDIADEEGWEMEANGEYLDYVKAKMEHYSDVWQDVGIQRAVGEFVIADDVVILLKHFPTYGQTIKAGDNNFPEDEEKVASIPDTVKVWESTNTEGIEFGRPRVSDDEISDLTPRDKFNVALDDIADKLEDALADQLRRKAETLVELGVNIQGIAIDKIIANATAQLRSQLTKFGTKQ